MVDAEMLKNVVLHSVATALASKVFPVPTNKSVEEIQSLKKYNANVWIES